MIGVVGIRYSTLVSKDSIAVLLEQESSIFPSSVLLMTCQRVEWYFSSRQPMETQKKIIQYLCQQLGDQVASVTFTLFDRMCMHHLFRVVAGLDSVFVGETEVQGQVKQAYESAKRMQSLPYALHFLFQRALHFGKKARTRCSSYQMPRETLCSSVVHTVLSYVERKECSPSVLCFGASTMNVEIAKSLHSYGVDVTVTNRTEDRAISLSQEVGVRVLPWDQRVLWQDFPCVISSVRSPYYLLTPRENGSETSQLLIDLGVPRNIDPHVASSHRRIMGIEMFQPAGSSPGFQEVEQLLASMLDREYARCIQ